MFSTAGPFQHQYHRHISKIQNCFNKWKSWGTHVAKLNIILSFFPCTSVSYMILSSIPIPNPTLDFLDIKNSMQVK